MTVPNRALIMERRSETMDIACDARKRDGMRVRKEVPAAMRCRMSTARSEPVTASATPSGSPMFCEMESGTV